jgi:hypothetical protein
MVVTHYSRGDSKAALAVAAAFMGARMGNEELLLPKVMPLLASKRRLEAVEAAGTLAEKGLISRYELDLTIEASKQTSTSSRQRKATATAVTFVDRILRAEHLRSGVLQYLRAGSTPGRTDYNGWTPTFPVKSSAEIPEGGSGTFVLESDLPADHPFWRRPANHQDRYRRSGFWLIDIPCGSPIALDAAIWARVDVRRERDAALVRARRSTGRPKRPLAGLVCGAGEARFAFGAGGDEGTYSIEVAPLDDGAVQRSRADWSHQHTVSASAASQRLGKLLAGVAGRVESGPLPVLSLPCEDTALGQAELDVQTLNLELEEIDLRLGGYARDMAQLGAGDRRYRAIERARDADEARATEIEVLLRDPTGSCGDPEPGPVKEAEDDTEELDADFAQLALVAGGLERCAPKGPAGLRDALVWMLDGGRGLTNLRSGAHQRQLLIDVSVRVPLADGSVEWIDAGTLDLTDRRQRGPRAAELTDDAARRLLWEREPVADVAERYGWGVGGLQHRIASWISRVVPNPWLRLAAITAASSGADIVVPRLIYAVTTSDSAAVDDLRSLYGDWAVSAVEAAYLDPDASWAHGTGWVRKPLGPWRSAMAAVAQSGPARRNSLIAAVPGLSNDEQLKDGLHPGRTSFWQPPLVLNDGWVSSHRCTRRSCPGGGDAPMTGFLPVPELVATNSAVFCRYCGCPEGNDEALPAAYLELWDVETTITAIKKANGIPHRAHEPPAPPMLDRTLRTKDVAEQFDLPHYAIQRLAERGALPSRKSQTGKLLFDEDDLSRPAVVEAIQKARDAYRGRSSDEETVDGETAAAQLGLPIASVRSLVTRGVIENVGSITKPLYRQSTLDEVLGELRFQLGNPEATFADTLFICDVADEIDVATTTVLRMIKAGVLRSVTIGRLTVVDVAALNDVDHRLKIALDPRRRLTARDIADRWGVREAMVLYHAKQGNLPSIQLYPCGRRYFIEAEVVEWLDRRAA